MFCDSNEQDASSAASMGTGYSQGGFGRSKAWALLTEWTQSESLRKHALAVEARVTACGEAEADRLGLTGAEHAAESVQP
jgi:hypothetical protein